MPLQPSNLPTMWADERQRPKLYAALYLAAFFGAIAVSHAYARGWL